jgi:hypothetical protein
MRRELCRIVGPPEPSGAFWAIKTPRMADASTADRQDSVQTGWDLSFLDLAGNNLPAQHWNIMAPLPESLQAVGSFETPAELMDLITPTLVEKAKIRLDQETTYMPLDHAVAVGKAIQKYPTYENAVWILRAIPEQLRSWAASLSRIRRT